MRKSIYMFKLFIPFICVCVCVCAGVGDGQIIWSLRHDSRLPKMSIYVAANMLTYVCVSVCVCVYSGGGRFRQSELYSRLDVLFL